MAMLEHDEEASGNGMSHRFRGSAIIALTLTFLAAIAMLISPEEKEGALCPD